MSELGERVHRTVGGRSLLDQPERDQGHEVVEQQVLVAVGRRVVEERCGVVGHGVGLLPGATRFRVGPRSVLRASDGIARIEIRMRAYQASTPALCGKFRAYRQICAQPRGAYTPLRAAYAQAT